MQHRESSQLSLIFVVSCVKTFPDRAPEAPESPGGSQEGLTELLGRSWRVPGPLVGIPAAPLGAKKSFKSFQKQAQEQKIGA